jgi:RNA polymerase sigma factor (sigma-70 family)
VWSAAAPISVNRTARRFVWKGDVLARPQTLSQYEALDREHRPRVLRISRLLLQDPDESEDVVQDVFVRLLRELEGGAIERPWAAWLARVTVNACRDRRRSHWWRLWRDASDEVREESLSDRGRSPEEQALAGELRGKAQAAFDRLPRRQREVFLLRQVEGFSTEEVARALGLSEGSVKRHLFRAVLRLRTALRREVR